MTVSPDCAIRHARAGVAQMCPRARATDSASATACSSLGLRSTRRCWRFRRSCPRAHWKQPAPARATTPPAQTCAQLHPARRPRRSPREQRRRLSHEGSDGFPQHRGIVAAAVSAAPDTTQSAEATTACGCPLGGGVALRRRRPSAVLIGAGIVVGGVRRVGARVAVDVGGRADTGVGVAPAGRHLADGGSPR